MIATSMPAAAQVQAGQISGVARASNGKALAGHTARLRHVGTGNLGASTTISTTGEFSFPGVEFGDYMVEIVNQAGTVVGTTSAISVTAASAVVSGVTVTATSSLLASILGGAGLTSFFTSTAGIITAAAVAGGLTAGVVATQGTASGSR